MNSERGGSYLSSELNVWKKHAASEMRIWLMEELDKERIGLPEVENFSMNLGNHFRSRKFKKKFKNKDFEKKNSDGEDLINVSMEIKVKDEKEYYKELSIEKEKIRRNLSDRLKKNSKTYRAAIKTLRIEATKVRDESRENIERK